MLRAANLSAILDFASVPLMQGIYELAAAGVIPGGTRNNHAYTKPYVEYGPSITEMQQLILNDAQTSGGLLIALNKINAARMVEFLREQGVFAVGIGWLIKKQAGFYIKVQ